MKTTTPTLDDMEKIIISCLTNDQLPEQKDALKFFNLIKDWDTELIDHKKRQIFKTILRKRTLPLPFSPHSVLILLKTQTMRALHSLTIKDLKSDLQISCKSLFFIPYFYRVQPVIFGQHPMLTK